MKYHTSENDAVKAKASRSCFGYELFCEVVFALEVTLAFVSLEEFKVYGYAVFPCCEVSGYELMSQGGFAFGVVEVDVDAFYVFAGFVVDCVVDYEYGVLYVLGVELFLGELFSGLV